LGVATELRCRHFFQAEFRPIAERIDGAFSRHAVALADEIGRPAHIRRRFTVGY
jgi:putative NADH-flavin reductase